MRITFQNPENGYCVLRIQPESEVVPDRLQPDGLVTLVGSMPTIDVGETIRAGGAWVRDPKYGHQFKAAWYKPILPSGLKGIEAYLGSGAIRGVGPVTARRIVEHFGKQTFEVLEHEIERLGEVPKIGRKTLAQIRAGWREAHGDRELVTFLGDHDINPSVATRLRKAYGEGALSVVKSNPYRLIEDVRGVGFHRADVIARKIGLPADADERLDAALRHILDAQSAEGHACLPRGRLLELAGELVGAPPERMTQRLDACLEQAWFCHEAMRGNDFIFLPALHEAEHRITDALVRWLPKKKAIPQIDAVAVLADFEQRARFELAPAQRDAVLACARTGTLILTGGPGTGKTTTVRSIIELFRTGRREVRLAAPTGRAARRLSETAKLPAETVHRMLGYQPHNGKFSRDRENPIEADLVIVDEASMLDVTLAASLFEALGPRSCLLLVGDEDQLPSVGPGHVLGDLIASGLIPIERLTQVFRQAGESLIVSNAHRINHGRMPVFEAPGGDAEPDCFFIERSEPAALIDTLRMLVGERIPEKFGLDPTRDVQVLTLMRRGALGVDALNAVMHDLLNPGHGPGFSKDDRVMQINNNYDKGVYNGDVGRVLGLVGDSGELHVDYDGRTVAYLADETDQLTLAYAVTIHKSQGSEYPAVIIPIHTTHWIMLQRNLLYTALTRGRRLVCLIGTKQALRRAVTNAERGLRHTGLRTFIDRARGRDTDAEVAPS